MWGVCVCVCVLSFRLNPATRRIVKILFCFPVEDRRAVTETSMFLTPGTNCMSFFKR